MYLVKIKTIYFSTEYERASLTVTSHDHLFPQRIHSFLIHFDTKSKFTKIIKKHT